MLPLLTNGNQFINSIFEKLANFIQLEINSQPFLQIKRQAMSTLFYLLNNQNIIEIFLQKSYVSIIAQLAIQQNSLLSKFNKQYYLTIDDQHQNLIECLSTSIYKYNGWKPYASKTDIQLFKQGRLGNNQFKIVPIPENSSKPEVLQQCGNKHIFNGRISPNSTNTNVRFPSFVIDNCRVNEGKWYFCVQLPVGGFVQIGWATDGFYADGNHGIGDDQYSWSYDGSRDALFHIQQFSTPFNNITHWKSNDVCGCGIEINGENINIKYWLNGILLGTAFTHQKNISSSSSIKCNLLPNGPTTAYFPGVTLKANCDPPIICQFIFSPEDMIECPLPHGYKPLLIPQLINIENSIVAYPFNAYLIGDNIEDYFYQTRTNLSKRFLRDFVNENHLILPSTNFGFPLSIDNDISSFTITFQFQIQIDQLNHIELLAFDTPENISIKIQFDKIEENTRTVIVGDLKQQQIKVYINNQCQIFNITLQNDTISKINLHLLPNLNSKITNIAIWKYDLSQEHIQRLFNYGLFYLSTDYQQLKEHKKQMNTFVFTQHEFQSELLVPFDQPFQEQIWEKKKKQSDSNESNYFKSSKIQLYGNKTYLILDKSNDQWFEYTIILDILISNYPINNERISILRFNCKTQLYITDQGNLCLTDDEIINENDLSIILNEYVRLFILIQRKSVKIYLNGSLEIEIYINDDQFATKLNHIELFHELDLTKNTTNEQTLRIECQSITFLNRSININDLDENLKQPNSSLEILVSPSFRLISSNLIAIGYKESWIKYIIEQYKITNIQIIDTILREHKQILLEIDFENQRKSYSNILFRLNPLFDKQKLEKQFSNSNDNINQHLEFILNHFKHFETDNQIQSEENINQNLNEWIKDKTNIITSRNLSICFDDQISDLSHDYKLFDLNQSQHEQNQKSLEYSGKEFLNCEDALITLYARDTINNIFKIWSNNSMNLEKFGDYSLIIKLFRIIYEHLINTNENVDHINLLIKSELSKKNEKFFSYLKNNIFVELIELIVEPSLLNEIYEQQRNFNFSFNILNIFIELINEKLLLIEVVFPQYLINLLFELFLLISTQKFKSFILQIFSKLIQIDQNFIFKVEIENFLFKLLSNLTTMNKHFQMSLMDLGFLLLIRRKEQEINLPENVKNLFVGIDLINGFNDQTKQQFLPQLEDISDDGIKLKQEDFIKSNQYFDRITDQQLISFMNSHFLLTNSFTAFIENLPNEFIHDSINHQKYPNLSKIPIDFIQIRCEFIYQLNLFIVKILPMIDFNLSPGQSFLTDQIRTGKIFLLHQTKFKLLNQSIQKTSIQYSNETLQVSFDTIKSNENTIFNQAYQQLFTKAHIHFRKKVRQIWQTIYVGMHSTDQGGLYRDSITQICSDICSTRLPLFILCPNGRTNVELNKDCWIPNVFPPNKPIPDELRKQYQFVGQLMGLAIRNKHYLDLKFPPLLWKQLLKESITIEDIQTIDIQSFTIINELEKNLEQIISNTDNNNNYICTNIFSELRFEVIGSNGQTYELIPDGINIQITSHNFKQYSTYYRQYRLNEFQRQIQFIHQGLCSIVPFNFLSLFTPNELEQAVCGKGQIDIELLKRNTQYSGSQDPNSPHIQRFWTVIGEMFNEEQRKSFLTFVWGRNTLPSQDQDFTMKFTINQYHVDDDQDDVDKALPRSHTCVFSLDLPEYSTAEIMYERLNYAITNCSSIDGNGNFNEEPNTVNLFGDSDSDD